MRGVYFLESRDQVVRNRTRAVRKSGEIFFMTEKFTQDCEIQGGEVSLGGQNEVSKPKN